MPSAKFTSISLFSGAMGLDLGLERSGRFEFLACVEKERAFCDTIRLNRDKGRLANPKLEVFEADIANLDPMQVLYAQGLKPGDLDLLSGGPPCQAFSVIGRRRGLSDARGQLIYDFARFVEHLRPRVFLMENVRGLLSMSDSPDGKKGALFEGVLRRFNAIGYRTDTFVVNSVNYGAPQVRERVIVIGNRINLRATFPGPTHSDRPGDSLKQFVTLGDALLEKPDHDPTIMDFSPRKKGYLKLVPAGGNWRSLPLEVQKESMGKTFYLKGGRSAYWRKLSFEYPCPTIVTMPNHAGTSLCHPNELRPLSVGECSRVKGFPDDWHFVGTAAEKYKQVGNAVPVILGEVAGRALAGLLDMAPPCSDSADPRMQPDTVQHLRPHVRTRWWWKDGEVISGLPYHRRPGASKAANELFLFDGME